MSGVKLLMTSGSLWGGVVLLEEILGGRMEHIRDHEGPRLAVNLSPPIPSEVKRPGINWRKYVYAREALSVVPFGEMTVYRPSQDQHFISIQFESDFLDNLFEQPLDSLVRCCAISDPTIYALVSAMRMELLDQHFVGRIYGESLTHALALHLITHYSSGGDALCLPKGKLSAGQLKKVIDYCYVGREADLSLADLAAQVSLSPFHFSRLFKQTIGRSPGSYIQQLKIDEAKRLIRRKNMPLTAIAYRLGFSDQAHFCHAFKKATGVSPKKF